MREPLLDGPIAGQSLTAEINGRPWLNPPQQVTVDDAIEYYLDRMSSEEFTDQLVDVLEMGVPVTTLANTLQLGSVMEGVHSVDTGMLVMPFIMEMIMLVGDSSGVKYDSGLENPNKGQTRDTMINKVRVELEERMRQKEGMFIDEEDEAVDMEEEEEIIAEEEPMGLMSRREQ
jgi:hypothetical protein|tara:strand:+ start:390 stop:911 length:522 start_codon:yes stop_codon:yes gene_type:complete